MNEAVKSEPFLAQEAWDYTDERHGLECALQRERARVLLLERALSGLVESTIYAAPDSGRLIMNISVDAYRTVEKALLP